MAILSPFEVWNPLIRTAVAVPLGYGNLQSIIMTCRRTQIAWPYKNWDYHNANNIMPMSISNENNIKDTKAYLSERNQCQQPNKAAYKEETSHPTNPRLLCTPRSIPISINPCLLICPPIQTQQIRSKTTCNPIIDYIISNSIL